MSGLQTEDGDGDQGEADVGLHADVDRVARANGWRSKAEYKGDPTKWITADVFLARGLEDPKLLRGNNEILVGKIDRLERQSTATINELKTQLGETLGTVATMTSMMRSAEQRAYDRARRELKGERDKAVETGDMATFQRLDNEIEHLDKTKPVDPPTRATPPVAAPAAAPPVPPEAAAFFQRNPWYQRQADLQNEADIIHVGLLTKRPELSLEQNLAEVERRMKAQFADRLGGDAPKKPIVADVDEDDRQNDPPSVTPSSNPSPRRSAGRFTFDTMPKDSKDAYVKYAGQLKRADENAGRKHEPLTKAEWAQTYWAQFTDTGP